MPARAGRSDGLEWLTDSSPGEVVRWAALSTNRQVDAYLSRLAQRYPDRVRLRTIGSTAGGLPIVAARLAGPTELSAATRPTVLIFAQQHGDEPAGKEACLLLIRDLVSGRLAPLSDSLDIWIVPQLNRDGADAGNRRNSRRADLNRGHHLLGAPEQRALYRLFHEIRPHVTIDLHEYDVESNAFAGGERISAYDLMADGPTNPNVGRAVRDLAASGLDALGDAMTTDDLLFRRYVRGDPSDTGGRLLRYSTLHVFDGRNVPAMHGCISFIVEATRHRDPLARLERRVTSTYVAVEALLRFAVDRAEQVLHATRMERRPWRRGDVALRAEYVPTVTGSALRYAYVQPADGERGEYVPEWAGTSVVVTRQRALPFAYWVEAGLDRRRLARLLRAVRGHGLTVSHLERRTRALVEAFSIDSVTLSKDGTGRKVIEVSSDMTRRDIPSGSLLIRTDQPGARLASLVLEPDSMDGLLASGAWTLRAGRRYPVRRVIRFTSRPADGADTG